MPNHATVLNKFWRLIGQKTSICLGIALITFALFWPLHRSEFISVDDDLYITNNPRVLAGLTWPGIGWAFSTRHAMNWHPLTWLSHMLDCQLFGANPGAHHLVSVAFHAINAALLFLLLTQMTGALWRSAFVAALFALHPIHVESVAWAAERKDVLSGFFWMLTLLAYVHYTKKATVSRYLLMLSLFALGLMAKPMLVTLPFVLLLLDYWPLNRLQISDFRFQIFATATSSVGEEGRGQRTGTWWTLVAEKIPFLLLAALSSVVTFIAQREQAVISLEILPLTSRIGNAFIAYAAYLRKTIWPLDLSLYYYHPLHPDPLSVALSATVLSTISLFAVLFARSRPYFLVGWLWFLGTLVPVIGLVQVGSQSYADRYTYITLIGIFMLMTWGLHELLNARLPRILIASCAALLLAACAVITREQISYWRDGITLFRRSITLAERNPIGQSGTVSMAELNRNRESSDPGASAQPYSAFAHTGLGLELARRGRTAEAIIEYRKAIQLAPNFGEALNDLAWSYATDPVLHDGAEAVHFGLRAASLLGDRTPDVLDTLAAAYAEAGRFEDAMRTARQGIDLAEAQKNIPLANTIRSRLALYERKKPFREEHKR